MSPDPYQTLGVARDASQSDIKAAYRKLARDLHPDRNPDNLKAENRFKEVGQAYEVLGNADKRKLFDEFGEVGLREGFDPEQQRAQRQWASRGFGGGGFGNAGGMHVGLEDLLGGAFTQRPRKGGDLTAEISLTFVQALRGVERDLALPSGNVVARIPAGVRDGGKVRLRGKGQRSRSGGPSGDLIITVRVQPHEHFWREGDDLNVKVPITIPEAIEGASVRVPTLDGEVTLKVPKGSQAGAKLRLKGRGASRGKSKGNLYVHLVVVMPESTEDLGEVATLLEPHYGDVRSELKL